MVLISEKYGHHLDSGHHYYVEEGLEGDAESMIHSCGKCGKTFQRAQYLTQHLKLHEPPQLKCNTCGKKFRWEMSHRRHMKSCKGPFLAYGDGFSTF